MEAAMVSSSLLGMPVSPQGARLMSGAARRNAARVRVMCRVSCVVCRKIWGSTRPSLPGFLAMRWAAFTQSSSRRAILPCKRCRPAMLRKENQHDVPHAAVFPIFG